MASIKRFEDLEIWQLARDQAKVCFQLSLIAKKELDYELMNALPKTSGSVMDNISEGFGRGGNKEFIQFLSIAYASCCELKSQLYRFSDRPYCKKDIQPFLNANETLKTQINAFLVYLKKSEKKGYKFKEEPVEYIVQLNDKIAHGF